MSFRHPEFGTVPEAKQRPADCQLTYEFSLQHYRIHTDIRISKRYLGIDSVESLQAYLAIYPLFGSVHI